MKQPKKQGDSSLWTPRERMAAALCAGCNPKTVDRHLDNQLPVRDDTADLLRYALASPVDGRSPSRTSCRSLTNSAGVGWRYENSARPRRGRARERQRHDREAPAQVAQAHEGGAGDGKTGMALRAVGGHPVRSSCRVVLWGRKNRRKQGMLRRPLCEARAETEAEGQECEGRGVAVGFGDGPIAMYMAPVPGWPPKRAPDPPGPRVPEFPRIPSPSKAADADLEELLAAVAAYVAGKEITEEIMALRTVAAVIRDRMQRRAQ